MLLVQLSPDAITLATIEDILENGTPTQVPPFGVGFRV